MANITQKRKLSDLLKRLGGVSETENSIMNGVLSEVERIEKTIPSTVDITPLKNKISEIEGSIAGHTLALNLLLKEVESIRKESKDKDGEHSSRRNHLDARIYKIEESIKSDINELKKSYRSLSSKGGGSMPRKWNLNGSTILSRYADVNFITSGWSVANDDVLKMTNITITGTGGGSGGFAFETPSGTINGVNATFTVTHVPAFIVINSNLYFQNNGYTLSGLTLTIDPSIIPVTGSFLQSCYGATTGGTLSGAGAPATTPTSLGVIYIDTTTQNVYISAGVSSSADWKLISSF